MQTDKWYLERRIYLAVGINISVASVLVLAYSAWVTAVHGFRWRRNGVVCGDWLLRDGKWALLARRRAALDSGIDAFRPLRGMCNVGCVSRWTSNPGARRRSSSY